MEETIAKQKFQNQKYSTRWNQNKKMKINERKEKKNTYFFWWPDSVVVHWVVGRNHEYTIFKLYFPHIFPATKHSIKKY
jgi:hypothetical protein